MNECTVIKTVAGLPDRWAWYPEFNVIALRPDIRTTAERDAVLDEVYASWRRSCIQIVPEQPTASFMENSAHVCPASA